MKKSLLLLFLLIGTLGLQAQDGYRISGKIDGVADGELLLMSDETGRPEQMATTRITNGAFMFTGKVDAPVAVYITTPDQKVVIPFILENTAVMLNVGDSRALVKGGEQQDIFARFNRLTVDLLHLQNQFQQAYLQAEQARDKKKLQELTKQFEEAVTLVQQKEKELLQQHADSYAAAYVVAAGARSLELEPLKARYNLLGETAKQTVPGRFVASQIEELEQLSVGNEAPDFTVVSQTGDSLSLYPIKSKLKLLGFWDSNNPKCREDNVTFLDIYQKYHLRGLEIVSISREENRQAWLKAINQDGMFWKQGLDANSTVFNRYHVLSIPYTVLLDEENKIIAKNLQGVDLRKKVAELLKRK